MQSPPESPLRRRERPLMVFDGDCGFCRLWIERWRAITGDRVEYAPYQIAARGLPEIPGSAFRQAVHFLGVDGRISRGAEAVFRSLAVRRPYRWMLWAYRRIPGVRPACEAVYALVARNRTLASRATRLLWGRDVRPPSYLLARWLLLRSLGLVYLLAFLSLWVQADGLFGPGGILPVSRYLDAAHAQVGADAYRLVPSLAWLVPGGDAVWWLCAVGVLLSVALMMGLAPLPVAAALWAVYLSVTAVGQVFLSFQWDLLLLEAGLLAVLLAPAGRRPGLGAASPPPRLAVALMAWLLFRLMFASGLVKLWSGDATWWDLTALAVHYETQPLPTAIAWYAHQLPAALHRASCAGMFAVELALPFLIPAPRRLRWVAFAGFAGLMAVVAVTGNYGFFNLLTVVIALILLDDVTLRPFAPRRARAALPGPGERPAPSTVRVAVTAAAFVAILVVSLSLGVARFAGHASLPAPLAAAVRWAQPLRSVNSYGLFSVMTTRRPEIRVEGSDDGVDWRPYVFRYKMGDPDRAPRWVAPHMPRLDWQMWFAALGSCRGTPWFQAFVQRLLEGSAPVTGLLRDDPFPGAPPRYIRTFVDDYRFTDWGDEAWWHVERQGPYCPVLSLPRDGAD